MRKVLAALGRLTNMVDAVGTTKYTYANGLLATEDCPWANDTVAWDYNTARMLRPPRLAHRQNASPQDPSEFPVSLSGLR